MIYDMFDDTRNKIEPEDIPYEDAVKYCVGVDFGTANPTAFLLMMQDSSGVLYVCKEYYFCGRQEAEENGNYECQKTDLEFSEDAKTFIGENYNYTGLTYTDIPFIVDPAANSFKLQLRRRRFRTKNANNEVLDGIRNVSSLLVQSKLKISSECENTLREIHTYSWDKKAQENTGRDVVDKKFDHCLVGDTLVDTTDGMKRIDSLVGKGGYVNTINPYTGEHCVKKFYNVRKTREHAEVIIIVLESDDKLKLTPEHLVLTDRGWVEAQDLLPDDDMIVSLNKKIGIIDKECCNICYDVYNMEVEGVHCFAITNSKIIVHNCMDAMRYGSQYLNEKHSIADVGRNIGLQ